MHTETPYLERALDMGLGYVLHFSDRTFGELFAQHGVDIHRDSKYQIRGTSKANKLRAFWELEPDPLVGAVLSDMMESYAIECDLNGRPALDSRLLEKVRAIIERLNGHTATPRTATTEDEFLAHEFATPNLEILSSTVTVETGPIRLFISHRDKHKKSATDLASELVDYGIASFVAHDAIQPMTTWPEEILKNLETMEVMLAFITDDFAESSWTNQEIGFALGKNIPVIPLKLQSKDPTGFIRNKQALRGDLENPAASALKIYNLLTKLVDKTRLKNALIGKFVQSSNYNEVKGLFNLMDKLIENLSEDQAKQIIEGFTKNDILHTAFYLTNNHNRLCVFLNRTTNKDYVIQGKEICIIKDDNVNNDIIFNDLNNFNSDLPF